jgi:hypothetical protein
MSVKDIKDELTCYTLIVCNKDTEIHHQEKWNGKTFVKTGFNGLVKPELKKLGINDGHLVTVDYHC